MLALMRIVSVKSPRHLITDAIDRNDLHEARTVVDDLAKFVAARLKTAVGYHLLEKQCYGVINGDDLVRLQ